MIDLLQKASYRYELPKHLIAQHPLADRQGSRLMVLDRHKQTITHKHFFDIIDYLVPGDVLVLNNTKVIPARLFGHKSNGTRVEIFLLHKTGQDTWKCLVHPGKRVKQSQELVFSDELRGVISASDTEGLREIVFDYKGDFGAILDKIGHIPLPPYIDRADESLDHDSYQTVYAKAEGSVAAPTAGLHFTQEILAALKHKGIIVTEVLLHVGLGTFRPVKTDDIMQHVMHSEYAEITPETAQIINLAKCENRRVIAVGTTSTRTIESFATHIPDTPAMDPPPLPITDSLTKDMSTIPQVRSGSMWTDIFIYPGVKIAITDGLITNFHLPESTLLMLVSALAGFDFVQLAYQAAIAAEYRFFSYGDAMLIL